MELHRYISKPLVKCDSNKPVINTLDVTALITISTAVMLL